MNEDFQRNLGKSLSYERRGDTFRILMKIRPSRIVHPFWFMAAQIVGCSLSRWNTTFAELSFVLGSVAVVGLPEMYAEWAAEEHCDRFLALKEELEIGHGIEGTYRVDRALPKIIVDGRVCAPEKFVGVISERIKGRPTSTRMYLVCRDLVVGIVRATGSVSDLEGSLASACGVRAVEIPASSMYPPEFLLFPIVAAVGCYWIFLASSDWRFGVVAAAATLVADALLWRTAATRARNRVATRLATFCARIDTDRQARVDRRQEQKVLERYLETHGETEAAKELRALRERMEPREDGKGKSD